MSSDGPELYGHLRPTGPSYEDGVYRVVGTADATVTLLQVGDSEARRVSTGRVVTVDRQDLGTFESAENPHGTRPPAARVKRSLSTAYWALRTFVEHLAGHPIPSAIALTILLAGELAEVIDVIPTVMGLPLIGIGAVSLW